MLSKRTEISNKMPYLKYKKKAENGSAHWFYNFYIFHTRKLAFYRRGKNHLQTFALVINAKRCIFAS